MRIAVTGQNGQVVSALKALNSNTVTIIALGRPDLDLAVPEGIHTAIAAARPDVVVNAAAYTAVDKAESEPDLAFAINADGAEAVAKSAAALGVPIIHISTDYVFAGDQSAPYVETDPTGPTGVYGASKLAGEHKVAAANPRHIIARTAWVYASTGANFLRTMLRVGAERGHLNVVDDQHGSPTWASDIADAIVAMARNVHAQPDSVALYGTFHMTATGATTWCGFARAIFEDSAQLGGPVATVAAITTADYPTPAKRPAHSVLNTDKLLMVHGVRLPDWRARVLACVTEWSKTELQNA
jgi:dTDP-4-dehydrorhamnose reductase